MDTLERLGYVDKVYAMNGKVLGRTIHPFLLPGTWHPPTDRDTKDKNGVPTVPLEEGRQCMMTAEKDLTVKVKAMDFYNPSRSSSKIAEEKKRVLAGQGNPLSREVSHPQMSMHTLGKPYSITNVEFTFASTFPLESRRAVVKAGGTSRVFDDQHQLIPFLKRQALNDLERQFSPHQQIYIKDFGESAFAVDATTSYSLRPPELIQFLG